MSPLILLTEIETKMKTFIALLCSLVITLANAEPFKLEVVPANGENIVMYKPSDWQFVTKEKNYNIYISVGERPVAENGWPIIQTITEFDEPQTYNFMERQVTRIFSYGAIDCENKRLYLLGDMFTSEELFVQYVQYHEMGSYISFLHIEGTARNEIYKVVCNTSI